MTISHLIDHPAFGVEQECCCCDPPQTTAKICAACRRYKETLALLKKNYDAFVNDIVERHRDQHDAHLAKWVQDRDALLNGEVPAKRRKERSGA